MDCSGGVRSVGSLGSWAAGHGLNWHSVSGDGEEEVGSPEFGD